MKTGSTGIGICMAGTSMVGTDAGGDGMGTVDKNTEFQGKNPC